MTTSGEDWHEYIRHYFSNLYKLDPLVEGSIEDFLGPKICNHPTVTASKLSETERAELGLPLQIDELDKALEKANMRSAPGIDA